jgi:outer membrane protein TolC
MRNLNREREDLVTEMGKKVYALYRRGKVENLDLLAACKRIDEIAAELEAAREALEKLRNEAKPELEVPEVMDDTPATVEPAPEPAKEPEPPTSVEPVAEPEPPAPEPVAENSPEPVAPAEEPADAAPEEPKDTI